MIASNSNKTLKETISSIYGVASIECLMPLNISFQMTYNNRVMKFLKGENNLDNSENSTVTIEGYISKSIFGKGRNSGDRQLCYINSRPCVLPQVTKVINEVYKNFNTTQLPFFVFNLKLDTSKYDVNVSPDKRTILLHGENMLIELIRENLTIEFEKIGHSVPRNNTSSSTDTQLLNSGKSQSRLFSSLISNFSTASQIIKTSQNGSSLVNHDIRIAKSEDEEGIAKDDSLNVSIKKFVSRNEKATLVASENEQDEDTRQDLSENEDDDLFVKTTNTNFEPTKRTTIRRSSTTIVDFDNLPSKQNHFDYDEPIEITMSSDKKAAPDLIQFTSKPSSLGISKVKPSTRSSSKYRVTNSNRSLEEFGEVLKYVGPDGKEKSLKQKTCSEKDNDEAIEEFESQNGNTGNESLQSDQDQSVKNMEEAIETREEDVSSESIKITMSQRIKSINRHRTHNIDLPVHASIEEIQSRHKRLIKLVTSTNSLAKTGKSRTLSDIPISNIADDEDVVEEMLNLSIHKNDFLKMNLVGQFNLGFILATKLNEKTGQKDLFIVDQHASDEIYNFERLQKETVIQNQPMVV